MEVKFQDILASGARRLLEEQRHAAVDQITSRRITQRDKRRHARLWRAVQHRFDHESNMRTRKPDDGKRGSALPCR